MTEEPESERPPYHCPVCGKEYRKRAYYDRHIETCAPDTGGAPESVEYEEFDPKLEEMAHDEYDPSTLSLPKPEQTSEKTKAKKKKKKKRKHQGTGVGEVCANSLHLLDGFVFQPEYSDSKERTDQLNLWAGAINDYVDEEIDVPPWLALLMSTVYVSIPYMVLAYDRVRMRRRSDGRVPPMPQTDPAQTETSESV